MRVVGYLVVLVKRMLFLKDDPNLRITCPYALRAAEELKVEFPGLDYFNNSQSKLDIEFLNDYLIQLFVKTSFPVVELNKAVNVNTSAMCELVERFEMVEKSLSDNFVERFTALETCLYHNATDTSKI